MIALLAAAVLAQSVPGEVSEVGKISFWSGTCKSLGWGSNREELFNLGEDPATDALSEEQQIAAATADGATLTAELVAEVQSLTTIPLAEAWLDQLEARCDALAQRFPRLLWRTPETAAAVLDFRSRFIARYHAR